MRKDLVSGTAREELGRAAAGAERIGSFDRATSVGNPTELATETEA